MTLTSSPLKLNLTYQRNDGLVVEIVAWDPGFQVSDPGSTPYSVVLGKSFGTQIWVSTWFS